ncbi:MAG: S-adenosylmethionine decarboxylase [Planctomycetota bacterium]
MPNSAPHTASEASLPTGSSSGLSPSHAASVGEVWSLDVRGLDAARLAGQTGVESLQRLFQAIIQAAELHPVAEPIWHRFEGENAGVTGIVALSESHLACHTFPEHAGLTLDLYTCVARPALARSGFWEELLGAHVGCVNRPVEICARSYARRLAPEARS